MRAKRIANKNAFFLLFSFFGKFREQYTILYNQHDVVFSPERRHLLYSLSVSRSVFCVVFDHEQQQRQQIMMKHKHQMPINYILCMILAEYAPSHSHRRILIILFCVWFVAILCVVLSSQFTRNRFSHLCCFASPFEVAQFTISLRFVDFTVKSQQTESHKL